MSCKRGPMKRHGRIRDIFFRRTRLFRQERCRRAARAVPLGYNLLLRRSDHVVAIRLSVDRQPTTALVGGFPMAALDNRSRCAPQFFCESKASKTRRTPQTGPDQVLGLDRPRRAFSGGCCRPAWRCAFNGHPAMPWFQGSQPRISICDRGIDQRPNPRPILAYSRFSLQEIASIWTAIPI